MRRPSRLAGAGIAAVLAVTAVTWHDGAAAAWATRTYPAWSQVMVPLSERGPLPWTMVLAAGVLVAAFVSVWRARTALLAWTRLAGLALLLAATFQASWGLHGATTDGAPTLLASAADASPADLEGLASRLRRELWSTAPTGAFDGEGAAAAVRMELGALAPGVRLPRRVKHPPNGLLGALGTSGVISPWTLEVHVEPTLPPWAYQAVLAHELAHLVGHEHEAHAEFAGLLAGLRSDHPHARYAAALRGWASLPATERGSHPIPPRAVSDLEDLRAHTAAVRREGLARLAWRVYDRWLRLRGQPEGTGGYAEGIRLLARALESDLW